MHNRLVIGVIGPVNSGKTSFINCILGGFYGKVGLRPTTMAPEIWHVNYDLCDPEAKLCPDQITGPPFWSPLNDHKMKVDRGHAKSLLINMEFDIIDYPGFLPGDMRSSSTLGALGKILPDLTVVVLVVPVDTIAYLDETNFVAELRQMVDVWNDSGNFTQLLLLISKCDLINPERDDISDLIPDGIPAYRFSSFSTFINHRRISEIPSTIPDSCADERDRIILSGTLAQRSSIICEWGENLLCYLNKINVPGERYESMLRHITGIDVRGDYQAVYTGDQPYPDCVTNLTGKLATLYEIGPDSGSNPFYRDWVLTQVDQIDTKFWMFINDILIDPVYDQILREYVRRGKYTTGKIVSRTLLLELCIRKHGRACSPENILYVLRHRYMLDTHHSCPSLCCSITKRCFVCDEKGFCYYSSRTCKIVVCKDHSDIMEGGPVIQSSRPCNFCSRETDTAVVWSNEGRIYLCKRHLESVKEFNMKIIGSISPRKALNYMSTRGDEHDSVPGQIGKMLDILLLRSRKSLYLLNQMFPHMYRGEFSVFPELYPRFLEEIYEYGVSKNSEPIGYRIFSDETTGMSRMCPDIDALHREYGHYSQK